MFSVLPLLTIDVPAGRVAVHAVPLMLDNASVAVPDPDAYVACTESLAVRPLVVQEKTSMDAVLRVSGVSTIGDAVTVQLPTNVACGVTVRLAVGNAAMPGTVAANPIVLEPDDMTWVMSDLEIVTDHVVPPTLDMLA